MFTLNQLIQAFDNNLLYAWEILYADILMQNSAINTEYLRQLVMLYSKGVQKCNHLEVGQNYFKDKINGLMGQKKVIQCLKDEQKSNNASLDCESGLSKVKMVPKLNLNLQARKRQIQMRLAYDIQQSKSNRIAKILKDQAEKEQKLQTIVKTYINSQQQKLRQKIKMRKQRISNPRMTTSFKMSATTNSQCMDAYESNSIFDQVPFIDDPDL